MPVAYEDIKRLFLYKCPKASQTKSETLFILQIYILFYCNTLGQISRLIYVQSFGYTYVVTEELKRNDCKGCGKVWICFWDVYCEVCCVFGVIIAKCCQTHKICSTALAFYHVADRFFIEVWLSQHTDHKGSILNQGNGSVFQFSCCIGF